MHLLSNLFLVPYILNWGRLSTTHYESWYDHQFPFAYSLQVEETGVDALRCGPRNGIVRALLQKTPLHLEHTGVTLHKLPDGLPAVPPLLGKLLDAVMWFKGCIAFKAFTVFHEHSVQGVWDTLCFWCITLSVMVVLYVIDKCHR
jgi:hypothetical protein